LIKKYCFLLFVFCITALFAENRVVLPVSFQAKFKQTISNEQKKKIIYQGKIVFSTPDHFKWSYRTPYKKEVCVDGISLQVVDHDLEQVSTYRLEEGLELSAILRNVKLHRPTVYLAKYKGKNYTIQVNRRQELSRIAYKDNLDNSVLIVFSQMKYGKKKINKRQMDCDFPDAYDQIGG